MLISLPPVKAEYETKKAQADSRIPRRRGVIMMTETVRNRISARLIAATLLVLSLCAAAGYARPSFAGRFTLPYEVNWGKNVLPAGQYVILMEELGTSATVRSLDGKIAFFTPMPVKDKSDGGITGLVVMIRGNERTVSALNLPHNGYTLVYTPRTAAERELLAKADRVATVPLVSSGK
jgi:hypothetical protein